MKLLSRYYIDIRGSWLYPSDTKKYLKDFAKNILKIDNPIIKRGYEIEGINPCFSDRVENK